VKVRSRAPLRLGIAGGGTDVSPYSDTYGGCVLNATVTMYAHCTIEISESSEIIFDGKDIGETFRSKLVPHLGLEGDLILHKAIYNRVVTQFNHGDPLPVKITTFSDAPPGSGLGSSSTMVVAILRAYQELLGLPLGEYDLAHLAFEIERLDCNLDGGKQDQYAATFGGFNFIEFYGDDKVIVNPLRIRNEIVNELEAHLLLYHTGLSRESSKIIQDQRRLVGFDDSNQALLAMHKVKESAYEMKEALLRGNILSMAEILKAGWNSKKKTSASITNAHVEGIYEVATQAGALATKLSGAGGGGFMMLFVEPTRRRDVEEALNCHESAGNLFNVHFENEGAQGWLVSQE